MSEHLNAIYQSGEKVPFSGTFEVVGASLSLTEPKYESTLCELKIGEDFATYQGMEVCWHLVADTLTEEKYPYHDGHKEMSSDNNEDLSSNSK